VDQIEVCQIALWQEPAGDVAPEEQCAICSESTRPVQGIWAPGWEAEGRAVLCPNCYHLASVCYEIGIGQPGVSGEEKGPAGAGPKFRSTNQPALPEAHMSAVANDDVVEQFNPEELSCFLQLLSNRDVFRARARIARGMVVSNRDLAGTGEDGTLEHLTRADDATREVAHANDVHPREPVPRGQEQHEEALPVLVREHRRRGRDQRAWVAHRGLGQRGAALPNQAARVDGNAAHDVTVF
jgi:hypothetical protein